MRWPVHECSGLHHLMGGTVSPARFPGSHLRQGGRGEMNSNSVMTSISTGLSAFKASFSAGRNSLSRVTFIPSAPYAVPRAAKSGLTKSVPLGRLGYWASWHADRCQGAVVIDHGDDVDAILDSRGHLLTGHQESTIAAISNGHPLRMG